MSSLARINRTLLFGIILFSIGVIIFEVIGTYLPRVHSEQPIRALFHPTEMVTDSCNIEGDSGYLSLKVRIFEDDSGRELSIPARVLVQGPDNDTIYDQNYIKSINSSFGRKPPGSYSATITNLSNVNSTTTELTSMIQYDLICTSEAGYNLGQSLGGVIALANLMYLAGFPIIIYGIVKQVRMHRKSKVQQTIDSAKVDSATPIRTVRQSETRAGLRRPVGVTILGILSIISGIVSILVAFASFLLAAVIINTPNETFESFREQVFGGLGSYAESRDLLEEIFLLFGGLLIALGIASVIVAYGLLKGRRWAWSFAVILSMISMILDIIFVIVVPFSGASLEENITSTAIGVTISALILYYLYRRNVRAFFGRIIEPR